MSEITYSSLIQKLFASDEFFDPQLPTLFPQSIRLRPVEDVEGFIAACEAERGGQKLAGRHRIKDWEDGWSGHGIAPDEGFGGNVPYYFKKNEYVRILDDVYRDEDGYLELKLLRVLQILAVRRAVSSFDPFEMLVEYGAGTGHNLEFLRSVFGEAFDFGGCDWASPAIDNMVVKGIVAEKNARRVDYFDEKTFWSPTCEAFAAFTNASLEQVGNDYREFIDWLVSNEGCVGGIHIEPVKELLSNSPLDRNAFEYCEARGYLNGFLHYLNRKDEISVFAKNFGLGSKFLSGYQMVLWRKL